MRSKQAGTPPDQMHGFNETASDQTSSWSQDTKRLVVVVMIVTAVLLVYLARSVLSLVITAAIAAYIFQPLVGWLDRKGIPRGFGTTISISLLLLGLAITPIILTPAIIDQAREIWDALVQVPGLLQEWYTSLTLNRPIIMLLGQEFDLVSTIEQFRSALTEAIGDVQLPSVQDMAGLVFQGVQTAGGVLGTAAGIATGVVSAIIAGVLAAILLLMFTFYLTKDGTKVKEWLHTLVTPAYWPEWEELLGRINLTWRSFFRGQILLSFTVGTVVFLSTTILGLPGALVLGILAGVLEVIPNLGPVLAAIPAVLLALIEGSSWVPVQNWVFALIVLGVYTLIQQVENNVLVPRIIGHSLNLHPMIVLIGVVVGASTAGILGAFLAAPVLASLKVLGNYAHAKLTDQEPFPESPGAAGDHGDDGLSASAIISAPLGDTVQQIADSLPSPSSQESSNENAASTQKQEQAATTGIAPSIEKRDKNTISSDPGHDTADS